MLKLASGSYEESEAKSHSGVHLENIVKEGAKVECYRVLGEGVAMYMK